jgi:hypothetical protein
VDRAAGVRRRLTPGLARRDRLSHRCEFCGIPAYTRTFVPLPNAVVLEELALLRAQGLREFLFLDDNFSCRASRPRRAPARPAHGLDRGLARACGGSRRLPARALSPGLDLR